VWGDTNTVFTNLDKQGGNNHLKHQAINAFETFKEKSNVFDSFRQKIQTNVNIVGKLSTLKLLKNELMLFLVSNALQDFVTDTGIIPAHRTCSDHGIPFITIWGFGIPSRGPDIWKFNNKLLEDESFKTEMQNKIPIWTLEAEIDLPDNTGAQWGFIKHKMGEFSREYGSKVKKAKLLLKSNLEKEIQTLSKNLNETNKLEYLSL
jgi:hypothetical protein